MALLSNNASIRGTPTVLVVPCKCGNPPDPGYFINMLAKFNLLAGGRNFVFFLFFFSFAGF